MLPLKPIREALLTTPSSSPPPSADMRNAPYIFVSAIAALIGASIVATATAKIIFFIKPFLIMILIKRNSLLYSLKPVHVVKNIRHLMIGKITPFV